MYFDEVVCHMVMFFSHRELFSLQNFGRVVTCSFVSMAGRQEGYYCIGLDEVLRMLE